MYWNLSFTNFNLFCWHIFFKFLNSKKRFWLVLNACFWLIQCTKTTFTSPYFESFSKHFKIILCVVFIISISQRIVGFCSVYRELAKKHWKVIASFFFEKNPFSKKKWLFIFKQKLSRKVLFRIFLLIWNSLFTIFLLVKIN